MRLINTFFLVLFSVACFASNKVNLLIVGPPGAGKGTQAGRLAKEKGYKIIATGALIRKEIKDETPLGLRLKAGIAAGHIPKGRVVEPLMEKVMDAHKDVPGFIFDGYPRNTEQAKLLDGMLKDRGYKLTAVVALDVDDEVLKERILGRLLCAKCGKSYHQKFNPPKGGKCVCGSKKFKKRSDDTESAIVNRLKAYHEQTKPILDYYKAKGQLEIVRGVGSLDDVYASIQKALKALV